jgi:hypothetical protein
VSLIAGDQPHVSHKTCEGLVGGVACPAISQGSLRRDAFALFQIITVRYLNPSIYFLNAWGACTGTLML